MSDRLLLEQVLIDSYNPSAFNSNQTFGSTTQSAASQSFTGTGNAIAKAQFYLGLVGSGLTGNVVATIYAHSGTYGTSSIPTGTALATSDTIDSSTLGLNSGNTLVTFTFSGANQITLTNGTNYVLAIEKTTLASDTGYMSVIGDSSGTHSGNSAFKNSGTWFSSAKDLGFTLISTDAVTTQSLLLEDGTSYLLLEDPVLIPDSYALSSDTSTSPLTWNHTIGNGTDRMLVVATALQGGTQGTVTAVTYNGVALTKAVGKQNLTGLGGSESTLWLLPNPAQGTHAVSVTATMPTTPDFAGASMSYFNAIQSTTPDATGSGSGATAGTSTAAITTVNTGAWTIGVMNFMNNGSTTGAITSSQTVREAAGMAININGRISVVDSGAAVTAGANTVSYSSTDGTGADSRNYTIAAISLAPVRSVAGTSTTTSSITKPLIYDIRQTPAAVSKALKYTNKTTPAAKTKSLQYATKKALALTKSLQYATKRSLNLSKGLIYDIRRTQTAISKSLKYTIKKTPTAIAKSLQYAIKRSASLTKGLIYDIKRTPTALTKSLKYTVKKSISTTKALTYDIKRTAGAMTKPLKYAITKSATAIVKSVRYTVLNPLTSKLFDDFEGTLASWISSGATITQDTTIFFAGTKAVKFTTSAAAATLTQQIYASDSNRRVYLSFRYYATTIPSANTQIARFLTATGVISIGVKVLSNGLIQGVNNDSSTGGTLGTLTTNAWHLIELWYDPTTGVAVGRYDNGTAVTWTNVSASLIGRVVIGTVNSATHTAYYDDLTVSEGLQLIVKSLKYTVSRPLALTKALTYKLRAAVPITKSVSYIITGGTVALKPLRYAIKKNRTLSKTLAYSARKNVALAKSLKYATAKPLNLTKGLSYAVKKSATGITKPLGYRLKRPGQIAKALAYNTRKTAGITKTLQYRIRRTFSAAKPLKYAVAKFSAITKSLKYTVLKSIATTKGLQYITTGGNQIAKSLKYTVKTTPVGVNLVTNGGFETGTTWPVTGWLTTVGTGPVIDSTVSHSGTQSAKLVIDASSTNSGFKINDTYIITVQPNTMYRLRLWVKSDTPGQLQVQIADATGLAGNFVQTDGITWNTTSTYQNVNTTTAWSLFDFSFTTAPGQTLVSIRDFKRSNLSSQANRTFWIDDVSIGTYTALTKSLRYTILKTAAVTRSLQYDIRRATAIAKGLKYTVKKANLAITKSLAYDLKTAAQLSRQLKYAIRKSIANTLPLRYLTIRKPAITKTLSYATRRPVSISKNLSYILASHSLVTKQLAYRLLRQPKLTAPLTYRLKATAPLTKLLSYYLNVVESRTIALNLDQAPESVHLAAHSYIVPLQQDDHRLQLSQSDDTPLVMKQSSNSVMLQ